MKAIRSKCWKMFLSTLGSCYNTFDAKLFEDTAMLHGYTGKDCLTYVVFDLIFLIIPSLTMLTQSYNHISMVHGTCNTKKH